MWCPLCQDGGGGCFQEVRVISTGKMLHYCSECEVTWFKDATFKYCEYQRLFPFLKNNNINPNDLDFIPDDITEGDTILHTAIREESKKFTSKLSEIEIKIYRENQKKHIEDIFYVNQELINIQNSHQQTSLHVLLSSGVHIETVRKIMEYGVNINIKDDTGDILLHISAFYGTVNMAMILHDLGSEINSKNIYGFTPLHIATFFKHIEMVKYLVSINADQDIRDNCDKTPLELARFRGYNEIAQILN